MIIHLSAGEYASPATCIMYSRPEGAVPCHHCEFIYYAYYSFEFEFISLPLLP